MTFPVDTSGYAALTFDPAKSAVSKEELTQLKQNIQIVRDTIVFFTAVAGAKGLGGHTGGAYSIVPEVLIADAFMRGSDSIYPVFFDEGGHRVAIQYAMAAFNGKMPFERLLHYREAGHGLYGHPELERESGIMFSSGRLGHMWPFVNGVARAHPDKAVIMFGSDGSQQEGNDAEAARFAVAQSLNVKLVIDDNNVTIAGHPREYMPGYDVEQTLRGHGMTVDTGDGEDVDALYGRLQQALSTSAPVALVNRRPMAPGIAGIEGTAKGHDVIDQANALNYLEGRGHAAAVHYLKGLEVIKDSAVYLGSTAERSANRAEFGNIINGIIGGLSAEERVSSLYVVDSDLEGSTGINKIRMEHPEVYASGGVMERANFSAAAGFGFDAGKQGIFSTFSAFLEMIISEATMARLNEANVLCHFSHAGVDDMADNTCHYGVNIFLAHSGLPEGDTTRLYFPADGFQFKAAVETIFKDEGLRFIFSTRSKVPYLCKEDGTNFYENDYTFVPGKDEVIREGNGGYVVSYGELVYRALDAVEQARSAGLDVGLVNKATLNVVDEEMMARLGAAPFVLVVEGQNTNTGLGSRFGTWLLERGYSPKYAGMGISRAGNGGTFQHLPYHGLAPSDILAKIHSLSS